MKSRKTKTCLIYNTRWRKLMGKSRMDSPEKLATLITHGTGQNTKINKTKTTTQKAKKKKEKKDQQHGHLLKTGGESICS